MRADSPARPTVTVDGKRISSHGGFTKREQMLVDFVAALASTFEPAGSRAIGPKDAEALVDSAEELASALMEHLKETKGKQYESLSQRVTALEQRAVPTLGK